MALIPFLSNGSFLDESKILELLSILELELLELELELLELELGLLELELELLELELGLLVLVLDLVEKTPEKNKIPKIIPIINKKKIIYIIILLLFFPLPIKLLFNNCVLLGKYK